MYNVLFMNVGVCKFKLKYIVGCFYPHVRGMFFCSRAARNDMSLHCLNYGVVKAKWVYFLRFLMFLHVYMLRLCVGNMQTYIEDIENT